MLTLKSVWTTSLLAASLVVLGTYYAHAETVGVITGSVLALPGATCTVIDPGIWETAVTGDQASFSLFNIAPEESYYGGDTEFTLASSYLIQAAPGFMLTGVTPNSETNGFNMSGYSEHAKLVFTSGTNELTVEGWDASAWFNNAGAHVPGDYKTFSPTDSVEVTFTDTFWLHDGSHATPHRVDFNFSEESIPEPATTGLIASAAALLWLNNRRKARQNR